MILLKILLVLFITALVLFGIVSMSIWIHINKRGTKIWHFVNKHIITDEDEYLKQFNNEKVTIARHLSILLTGKDLGNEVNKQRTKVDRAQSFAYVKAYIYKEKSYLFSGMVFMMMGLMIDLCVPIYIGVVTQLITD